MLVLSAGTETRNTFKISDHPGCMIDVGRVALRAIIQGLFIDMMTIVADCNSDIETKIIAPGLGCCMDEIYKTLLVWCFFKIKMEGRTSIEIFNGLFSMKNDLIQGGGIRVFNLKEVGIITVSRDEKSIFSVPFCIFNTYLITDFFISKE